MHDSPDYQNLKVSVFNDDKKTDMIGEMWVDLGEVVMPGGGRKDSWHTLNFKGKYAGEVMLELTYYDSRVDDQQQLQQRRAQAAHEKKIRRRPLPELHTTPLPHQMENTRTAGPRAMGAKSRAPSSHATMPSAPPVQHPQHPLPPSQHDDLDYHPGFAPPPLQRASMPDLPELPPIGRSHRVSLPPPPPGASPHAHAHSYHHARSPSHPELIHSHSAPTDVPHAAYPAPDLHHRASLQPTVEDEGEDLPPLPPSHRSSASIPRQWAPRQSPLQSLERRQAESQSPQQPPARRQSADDYNYSPTPSVRNFRNSYSGPSPQQPPSYAASSAGSSYGRPSPTPQCASVRHSMTEPYNTVTPPRAHPLANEMRQSTSPVPFHTGVGYDEASQYAYPQDAAPIIKPRAISPVPSVPRKSIASIRHPVQSYALQEFAVAASTSHLPSLSVSSRQSAFPRPISSGGPPSSSGMPFSPDDFAAFNPNATQNSPYTHTTTNNPHSPYHIPNGPRAASEEPEQHQRPLPNPDGPITTWDGRTVDPSDHLPVHSWAPEPEKATRTSDKVYGAGAIDPNRPRGLSGPRQNVHLPPSGGRIGRDMVVNVRTKNSPNLNMNHASPTSLANGQHRLTKRATSVPRSPMTHDSRHQPLHEIDVPNPYTGGSQYGEGLHDPHNAGPHGSPYYQQQQHHLQQDQQGHYGDIFGGNYENSGSQYGGSYTNDASSYAGSSYDGYGGGAPRPDYAHLQHPQSVQRAYSEPPEIPPKIPFVDRGYGVSALERELAGITIGAVSPRAGGSSRGTVRSSVAGGSSAGSVYGGSVDGAGSSPGGNNTGTLVKRSRYGH